MVPVLTNVDNLCVDSLGKPGFTSSLCHRKPVSILRSQVVPVELPTIRQCGNGFQTKINTEVTGAGVGSNSYKTNNVDIPASASVFVERDGAHVGRDFACLPEPECLAAVFDPVAQDLDVLVGARNPPKTTPCSFGLTPRQLAALGVESSSPVFLAHLLDGLGVQAQFLTSSVGELHQIVCRKPLAIPTKHVKGSLIAEVPHKIYGVSHADQLLARRSTVLDPKLVGSYMLQGFLTRSTIGTGLRQDVEGGASPTTSMYLPPHLSTPKVRLVSPCLKAGALRRFQVSAV